MMNNKRSQVASTMTWFVAFIVIFFIMILFISGTVVLSARKLVTYGKNEIKFENYEGDLRSQEELIKLLNSNFNFSGKNSTLKNILAETDMYSFNDSQKQEFANKVKQKILAIANEKDCYVFQALWGIKDADEMVSKTDPRGKSYVSNFIQKNSLKLSSYDSSNVDLRGVNYLAGAESDKIEKSANLVVLRSTKKNIFSVDEEYYQTVNIKFYIGDC